MSRLLRRVCPGLIGSWLIRPRRISSRLIRSRLLHSCSERVCGAERIRAAERIQSSADSLRDSADGLLRRRCLLRQRIPDELPLLVFLRAVQNFQRWRINGARNAGQESAKHRTINWSGRFLLQDWIAELSTVAEC